jgi:putative membrane protein
MKLLARILLSAVAVLVIGNFMDSIYVDDYKTAIIVAVILGLLNMFVKPILVILTLPVTFLTFGLFLLIINAIIILMADSLIDGFSVSGVWSALIFSLLLSILESIFFSFLKDSKS